MDSMSRASGPASHASCSSVGASRNGASSQRPLTWIRPGAWPPMKLMRAVGCSCSFITRYDTRMPPLLVIPALPRTADIAREALPALPALCELLRLADAAEPDRNWRSGLLRDLGAVSQAFPEAVIAASALRHRRRQRRVPRGARSRRGGNAPGAPARGGYPAASRQTTESVLAEGLRRAVRSRTAAARLPETSGCSRRLREARPMTRDPLDWAGAPLERRPASSPEQRLLRRLGAEIEMWLADLPVERAAPEPGAAAREPVLDVGRRRDARARRVARAARRAVFTAPSDDRMACRLRQAGGQYSRRRFRRPGRASTRLAASWCCRPLRMHRSCSRLGVGLVPAGPR